MRGWLQAALAVAVISGWFLVALWMVVSVMQIGMIGQTERACTIAANLEVNCDPFP